MNRSTPVPTPVPARHSQPLTKACRLAYLMWERPDLQKTRQFLTDFGLTCTSESENELFMRAADPSPFCYWVRASKQARFVGFALEVNSESELSLLSKHFNADIKPLRAPGGGQYIELLDPAGNCVHVVHGLGTAEPIQVRAALEHNTAYDRLRVNHTQRSDVRAHVHRLGHVVLEVANFSEVTQFYTQVFGFIPSDVQVLPDGAPAVAFMRLDKGATPADHHTLAVAQGFMATYSHSAFEVTDADAVGMGQRLLREKGYAHAWGMGRHILGSQIFDYWNDPWGAKHEHYSDGDMFTSDHPTGVYPVSRDAMAQWGPPMPSSFTRPHFSPSAVRALIKNLSTVPDLTMKKLITLAKLFA